jgi:hypothetical protein
VSTGLDFEKEPPAGEYVDLFRTISILGSLKVKRLTLKLQRRSTAENTHVIFAEAQQKIKQRMQGTGRQWNDCEDRGSLQFNPCTNTP